VTLGTLWAVSSGTAALHTAFHAIGLQKGDEVIRPSTLFASSKCNCDGRRNTCFFVDIDEKTYNIDPAKIEQAITKKPK